MKKYFFIFILISVVSCEKQSKYAIDQKSEMAQRMLDMHEDLKLLQSKIKSGEDIGVFPEKYNDFAVLEMTDESMREKGFEAYALALLESEKELYNAAPENRKQAYQQVVNNCLACHETIGCRGPIPKIKKLAWKE